MTVLLEHILTYVTSLRVASLYHDTTFCLQMQNLLSSSLLSKNVNNKTYRTTILPIVLYGCETWSFTLKEESRLRVFENSMQKRIFGRSRAEVTGDWRRIHNDEHYVLYS